MHWADPPSFCPMWPTQCLFLLFVSVCSLVLFFSFGANHLIVHPHLTWKRTYTRVTTDTVYSFKRFAMDCHSSQVSMQCRTGCVINICTVTWHCSIVQSTLKMYFFGERSSAVHHSESSCVGLTAVTACEKIWHSTGLCGSPVFLLCVLAWVVCSPSARLLKQMSFYSKMALSLFFFLCCRQSSFPNNERANFRHEVLIVGVLSMHLLCVSLNYTIKKRKSFGFWLDLLSFFAVTPPSDLRFKILNENTVEMTWKLPQSRIEGFRIQVSSGTGG